MTLHCVLVGMVLHCQTVKPSATEADWVRRFGVLVAFVGTLVAAPDGAVLIGRWIWTALWAIAQRTREFLARFLPFLQRSANVQGVTAVSARPLLFLGAGLRLEAASRCRSQGKGGSAR
jgi:hypothetical protein